MTRTLILKCIREGRWLFLATAAIMFAFCWLRVWMVSRIDAERFKGIIDMLPSDWQKFSPVDIPFLITYTGRISAAYSEPIVVFGICAWAIARGSDVVSGELGRGTLEMLLAQPISRMRVLWTHAAVTTVGTVCLAFTAWGGTFVGVHVHEIREEYRPSFVVPIPGLLYGTEWPNPFAAKAVRHLPMTERVETWEFLPATLNLCCFGFFIAGLTTLFSTSDRYRSRTIGAACLLLVLSVITKLTGMAGVGWDWARYVSVFSVYEPEHLVMIAHKFPEQAWSFARKNASGESAGLGPLGYDLILLALGHLAYAIAAVIFHRRDLPAPT